MAYFGGGFNGIIHAKFLVQLLAHRKLSKNVGKCNINKNGCTTWLCLYKELNKRSRNPTPEALMNDVGMWGLFSERSRPRDLGRSNT